MTGFTKWLDKVFRIRAKEDLWKEHQDTSKLSLLLPSRFKVHIRNERVLEYKIQYLVSPGVATQQYDVRLYLFFTTELDAAQTSFFSSLYECVRLHIPRANMATLVEREPGTPLYNINIALKAIKAELKDGQPMDAEGTRLVYLLQLHACTFRRAVRQAVKRIVLDLREHTQGKARKALSAEEECSAALGVADLLAATSMAVTSLEQACADCEDERVPAWLREEWRLVDEQILVEGRVSLLKLAARLGELCPLSCGRGPAWHAHPPAAQAKGSQGSLEGLTGQVQELRERLRSCTQQAACCEHVQSAPMEQERQALPSTVAADLGSAKAAKAAQQIAAADGQGQGGLGIADGLAQTSLASDWQLSPESRADGQSFSLVFINPRALFNVLGRYSVTLASSVAHRLPLQGSRSGVSAPPMPQTADAAPEEPDLEQGLLPAEPTVLSAEALQQPQPQEPQRGSNSAGRSDTCGSAEVAGQGTEGRQLLRGARDMALRLVQALERASEAHGYSESLLAENSDNSNDTFTDRVKVLKRHAAFAVTLAPRTQTRSFLLDDLVGMTVAGLAMGFALVTLWLAQRSSAQFGALYIMIYIMGYILKDRIKEYGKRYLQPAAEWFGFEFPDRIFQDSFGKTVGRCREWVSVKDGHACSPRVLRMRYSGYNCVPTGQAPVLKPERVLVYSKKMAVAWHALDAQLQGVRSLDDVMRIDLHYLCRGMQPASEGHFALQQSAAGELSVGRVQCSRVYHVNSVLEIRSQGSNPERSMQLEKMRIIMDREGIKRLEPGGAGVLTKRARHGQKGVVQPAG